MVTLIIVSKITCLLFPCKWLKPVSLFFLFFLSFSPNKSQKILNSCCLIFLETSLFFSFFIPFFFSFFFFLCGKVYFLETSPLFFSFFILFSFCLSFYSESTGPSDLNYSGLFFLVIAIKQIGNFWSTHFNSKISRHASLRNYISLLGLKVSFNSKISRPASLRNLFVSLLDHSKNFCHELSPVHLHLRMGYQGKS